MKNYNGRNKSERDTGFAKRRGRDSGRSSLHRATCDNCGKDCEVPFKPTSGKPIFCSDCFEKLQYDSPKKVGQGRRERTFKRGDSGRRSFADRDTVMFEAVCDSCGKDCEVPFKPTRGKPVFCSNCFEKQGEKHGDQSKNEFAILNKKLDKILELLTPVLTEIKSAPELEETTETPKPEKKARKKTASKKGTKKKD